MICGKRVHMWGRKWVLSEVCLRSIVSHSVCVYPDPGSLQSVRNKRQSAHSYRRTLGQPRRCIICNLYITVQSRVTARGQLFQISFPACCTKETQEKQTNYNNCAIISTQIVIIIVQTRHLKHRDQSLSLDLDLKYQRFIIHLSQQPSFLTVLCVGTFLISDMFPV